MKTQASSKMTVLVTGAGGFVARYVIDELLNAGHKVIASDFVKVKSLPADMPFITADLSKREDIIAMVKSSEANACIHLGALTNVPASKNNPSMFFLVNIVGTLDLLDAFRQYAPNARILVASTSHVYGVSGSKERINESAPLCPASLYAISKAAVDLAALQYHKDFGLNVMTTRAGNHTGPGQTEQFVVGSLAAQVARIKRGESDNKILTGNLESLRVFTDVRDIAHAYRLVLEKGTPGQAYNISSAELISIGEVLNILCKCAGISPELAVDPEKFRPFDSAVLLDTSSIEETTGWEPKIPLEQTLREMLASMQ